MKPLVSIVIPTYNRASDLARALDSVINQTYVNWEALVVDNHSQDETDDVIASYNDQRIKLFKIHNNGVIAASRNVGIDNAEGEFVAFLDSDDWWTADKLKKSVDCLVKGMDIIYHDLLLVYKKNQKFVWRTGNGRALSTPIYRDLIVDGNPLETSSVVVRTSILRKVGGLSEKPDLFAWEDYDTWIKISKITEKFHKLKGSLGFYWIGGGNVSNPSLKLKNLQAFENKYGKDIIEFCGSNKPWWVYYGQGRACYILGDFEKSQLALKQMKGLTVPFSVKIKTILMSCLIRFIHKY